MSFMDIIKLINMVAKDSKAIKAAGETTAEVLNSAWEFVFSTKQKEESKRNAEDLRKLRERNKQLLKEMCAIYKSKYGDSWKMKVYDDLKNTDTYLGDEYMSVIEGA